MAAKLGPRNKAAVFAMEDAILSATDYFKGDSGN
jgi:hypothetical protein